MASDMHAAQLASMEARVDRFQTAFDVFRMEANKDNRDRDRLIERAAATNEAQNARMEQIILGMRRLDDYFRNQGRSTPQRFMPNIAPDNGSPIMPPDPPTIEARSGEMHHE